MRCGCLWRGYLLIREVREMETLAILGGTPVRTAPWPKWPVSDEREEELLLEVLRSGNWWRHSYGQGVELSEDEDSPSTVARFQKAFARAHGCKYGICAANGTVTLEIALRAAGVKPGDEVIVPAYTYIATATAPMMVGAIPIFVDIDADTYNIDPRCIEEAITEHTTAIVPVHFGGQPCEMDRGYRGCSPRSRFDVPEAAMRVPGRLGVFQLPVIEEHDSRRRRADNHKQRRVRRDVRVTRLGGQETGASLVPTLCSCLERQDDRVPRRNSPGPA